MKQSLRTLIDDEKSTKRAVGSPTHLVLPHDRLTGAAVVVLQMACASMDQHPRWDPMVLRHLGFARDARGLAFEELRAEGLLGPDDDDYRLDLTLKGRALVDDLWPLGQLGDDGPAVVIGAFDGQDELPVRLCVPVRNLSELLPRDGRILNEAADQGLALSAWELRWPATGEPDRRLLVRVDQGAGEVLESHGSPNAGRRSYVEAGSWLSIDRAGRCRETRNSLENLVFLIDAHWA